MTPVGYSYWRNSNAHEGSNDMWIFLSLNSQKGGSGPTLFRLDKATDSITKVGPLFPTTSQFSGRSGDGWYFSASRANQLYINDGPKLLRYDVTTHHFETVFDLTGQFGSDREVWQMHSSNDDLVHSATLRAKGSNTFLGCLVFSETTGQFSYFPKKGALRRMPYRQKRPLSHDPRQYRRPQRVRRIVIVDVQTGVETVIYDEKGGVGHADMGYNYVVGADGYNPLPNAFITWSFAPSLVKGPTVFHSSSSKIPRVNHVSHQNAKPGLPMHQQFACGSSADRGRGTKRDSCVSCSTGLSESS